MRIKVKAGLIVLLLSMFLMPSSAMSFGTATVDSTLTVSGLNASSTVQFILNGGVPVFAIADSSGKVNYMPLLEGTLRITVMEGGQETQSATTTVVAAPVQVQTSSSNGGGGGGSGGGGVITAENRSNILKSLRVDGYLRANTSIPFDFSKNPDFSTDFSIYLVLVMSKESEGDSTVQLELLKGTSSQVTSPPPGKIFKNVNILSTAKRLQEVRIRFAVENSWISGSGGESKDIKLLKWEGGRWIELVTSEISRDASITSFEGITTGFSPFAISNTKAEAVPTATRAATTTPAQTTVPVSTPVAVTPSAAPPVSWAYVLILIVVIAIAAYIYTTTWKKEKK